MSRTQVGDRTWRAFCRDSGGLEILGAMDASLYVRTAPDAPARWVLDFMSGCWTCNLGHGNRQVKRALQWAQQEGYFAELMTSSHPHERKLSDALCNLLGYHKVIYMTSGSSAMDTAIRLAFQATAKAPYEVRQWMVSLDGAYHGSTGNTLAIADPHAYQAWHPYGFRRALADWVFDEDLDLAAKKKKAQVPIDWGDAAAFVFEPVQGVGGVRTITDAAYMELFDSCHASGGLVIADEVTSGMGRTSGLAYSQTYPLEYRPDILVLGKALTNGAFPLSAVLLSEEVCERLEKAAPNPMYQSIWGESYGGHPIGCKIALAVLQEVTTVSFFSRVDETVRVLGEALTSTGLRDLATVRQQGMFVGVDLTRIHAIRAQKVLLADHSIRTINHGSTLVLAPPLTIDHRVLKQKVETIAACIAETRR